MKFIANKDVLHEAITNAARAVSSKSAVNNTLDGVLVVLEGNKLTLTGYDLEMGIRLSVYVKGEEDGKIVVDPKMFGEFVRRMPSSEVDIELKGGTELVVKGGRATLKMPGKPADDYPNVMELAAKDTIVIGEKVLRDMLVKIAYSSAVNDLYSAVLISVRFEITNNELYAVASDGVRVSICIINYTHPDTSFTVPKKTIDALIRKLSSGKSAKNEGGDHSDGTGDGGTAAASHSHSDGNGEDSDIEIIVDRNQVSFVKEDYMIISRLLDGKYIDYLRVAAIEHTGEIILNTKTVADAMTRCLLLFNDKYKSPAIFEIGRNIIKASCKTIAGDIYEEIETITKTQPNGGDTVIMGLNPKFVYEAMQNADCDEVRFEYSGSSNPVKITPLEGNEFKFIIVPMRIT